MLLFLTLLRRSPVVRQPLKVLHPPAVLKPAKVPQPPKVPQLLKVLPRFGRRRMTPGVRDLSRGATLIELVLVIFLFGVIGVVALSRVLGDSTFDQIVVRDQFVAMARFAQNARLGRAPISLTLQPSVSGDQITLTAAHGSTTLSTATVDSANVTLRADINETASCGVTDGASVVSNANPLVFSYEPLGDLGVSGVTGGTGTVLSAARLCINANPAMSVCVAQSGYAAVGDCDV